MPVLRLPAMKPWRVWLLLCLMLLVPFRGAVAAAMLCPPVATGHHVAQEQEHAHAHHGGHAGQQDPGRAADEHGDRCRLCAAFCSVAGIVHTAPAGVAPQGPVKTVFPEAGSAAPSFLADGQERPPRSS